MSPIATTFAQSKKLRELGLSDDCADMYITFGKSVHRIKGETEGEKVKMPSWSLSVLLDMLPESVIYNNTLCVLQMDRHRIQYLGSWFKTGYTYTAFSSCDDEKPLFEHVYNAIVWLLENKLLNA